MQPPLRWANSTAVLMKAWVLLIAMAFCAHGFAASAEPPKIKGYAIGMPLEKAMEMNRALLADFLTQSRQGKSEMIWSGGLDGPTQLYHYTLIHRVGGEREPDSVRGSSSGNLERIVLERLAVPLFQIEGVDNQKIITAFEAAYGLSNAKISANDATGGLTAVWYHKSGVRIMIECYNDSLRVFSMEKADDDESLRAKLTVNSRRNSGAKVSE